MAGTVSGVRRQINILQRSRAWGKSDRELRVCVFVSIRPPAIRIFRFDRFCRERETEGSGRGVERGCRLWHQERGKPHLGKH